MSFKPVLIYVTTPTKTEAKDLGVYLVENKLAACANIIDNMESIYYYDDTLQKDKECILILKTQKKHTRKIIKTIKEYHSYKCPAIFEIPITNGSKEFLNWIKTETA